MESSKNQNHRSWDKIVEAARRETPPDVDVRAAVRAQIEREKDSRVRTGRRSAGLLDGLIELFSGTVSKAVFAVACACIAFAATQSIIEADASQLIEVERIDTRSGEGVFENETVDLEAQWVAYL